MLDFGFFYLSRFICVETESVVTTTTTAITLRYNSTFLSVWTPSSNSLDVRCSKRLVTPCRFSANLLSCFQPLSLSSVYTAIKWAPLRTDYLDTLECGDNVTVPLELRRSPRFRTNFKQNKIRRRKKKTRKLGETLRSEEGHSVMSVFIDLWGLLNLLLSSHSALKSLFPSKIFTLTQNEYFTQFRIPEVIVEVKVANASSKTFDLRVSWRIEVASFVFIGISSVLILSLTERRSRLPREGSVAA